MGITDDTTSVGCSDCSIAVYDHLDVPTESELVAYLHKILGGSYLVVQAYGHFKVDSPISEPNRQRNLPRPLGSIFAFVVIGYNKVKSLGQPYQQAFAVEFKKHIQSSPHLVEGIISCAIDNYVVDSCNELEFQNPCENRGLH